MATLKNNNRYPSLPVPGNDLASHTAFLLALKENIETHERRRRGSERASFVTLGEMEELGLLNITGDQQIETPTEWDAITGKPTAFPPQAHSLAGTAALGSAHTVSGLTAGQVLRATGATTARFMELDYTDIANAPPQYLIQTEEEKFWVAGDFIKGHNIIGVRYDDGPSTVYLPHTLPVERLIIVKDEAGLGAVTILIY